LELIKCPELVSDGKTVNKIVFGIGFILIPFLLKTNNFSTMPKRGIFPLTFRGTKRKELKQNTKIIGGGL